MRQRSHDDGFAPRIYIYPWCAVAGTAVVAQVCTYHHRKISIQGISAERRAKRTAMRRSRLVRDELARGGRQLMPRCTPLGVVFVPLKYLWTRLTTLRVRRTMCGSANAMLGDAWVARSRLPAASLVGRSGGPPHSYAGLDHPPAGRQSPCMKGGAGRPARNEPPGRARRSEKTPAGRCHAQIPHTQRRTCWIPPRPVHIAPAAKCGGVTPSLDPAPCLCVSDCGGQGRALRNGPALRRLAKTLSCADVPVGAGMVDGSGPSPQNVGRCWRPAAASRWAGQTLGCGAERAARAARGPPPTRPSGGEVHRGGGGVLGAPRLFCPSGHAATTARSQQLLQCPPLRRESSPSRLSSLGDLMGATTPYRRRVLAHTERPKIPLRTLTLWWRARGGRGVLPRPVPRAEHKRRKQRRK